MEKTEIMQRQIHREVLQALVNSRLPYDHPIGEVIEREAEVVGVQGSPCIRTLDADGNWVMLEERIKELKADPRFSDSFPDPTRVAKRDLDGVRDNFEAIAKGTAVVE